MPAPATVSSYAVRNYWWASVLGGLYFVAGFVAWGGTRGSIISSGLFLVCALIGLTYYYRIGWPRRTARVAAVVVHLAIGQQILIWQLRHLPLSDYTATGNPDARAIPIYLVSSLIVGGMSMFGGVLGAVLGLSAHYAFIADWREEFSFKWTFPLLIAMAGNIVSSASWRLDAAYQEMARLASHDNLTGLFNRRRLETEFTRMQSIARETGRALLLVAWDIDDLKLINDTDGHAAGDAYIREFARVLQANVRTSADARAADAAFRVGGDEFISLHLDGPDGDAILARTHRDFPSVSAGWVRCDALTFDQALTQADAAMYREKAERKQARVDARP